MTDAADPLVLFMPSGKRGRFPVGTSVLEAARTLGVYVESVCGGRATCGRCQIEVQEGQFAKHGITSSNDHISPVGPKEKRYAEVRTIPEGRRLSCSAQILGEVRGNFDAFLAARPAGAPFCYWFGPTNTHRIFQKV